MNKTIIIVLIIFIRLFFFSCEDSSINQIVDPPPIPTNNEYLGQTPPGKELKPFAPDIIGHWNHGEVTVSPDGQEIYWSSNTSIIFTKVQNGKWTTPQVVAFSGHGSPYRSIPYDDVPVVSPDNKKLFFLSLRPIGYASPNREHIWYVERTSTG